MLLTLRRDEELHHQNDEAFDVMTITLHVLALLLSGIQKEIKMWQ